MSAPPFDLTGRTAVIHTPMLDQVNQETIDYMVSKIPVGRTGTTE